MRESTELVLTRCRAFVDWFYDKGCAAYWASIGAMAEAEYGGRGGPRAVFECSIKHRPRIRLTIRLDQWPPVHGEKDQRIAKPPVLLRARDRKAARGNAITYSFIAFHP
jgi:hypothetical protein